MDTLSRLYFKLVSSKCFLDKIARKESDLFMYYVPLLQELLVQAKDRELGYAQQQLRQQVTSIIACVEYT